MHHTYTHMHMSTHHVYMPNTHICKHTQMYHIHENADICITHIHTHVHADTPHINTLKYNTHMNTKFPVLYKNPRVPDKKR